MSMAIHRRHQDICKDLTIDGKVHFDNAYVPISRSQSVVGRVPFVPDHGPDRVD